MGQKMKTDCFIQMVGPKLLDLAYRNKYHVVSPVIAQAILESGWGSSMLADVYNYFGMKANSRWHGESVDMSGEKWRKYNSLIEGLEGYYKFIEIDRYDSLRVADDFETYCYQLRECGYCTSDTYSENLIRIVQQYDLERFDDALRYLNFGGKL